MNNALEQCIEAQEEFDFNTTKKILGAWLPINNVEIKRFDLDFPQERSII